jgi:hypothetical protein
LIESFSRFASQGATVAREKVIEIGKGSGADTRLGSLDGSLRDLLLPLVPASVLADTLGLSARRLQQLASENILPRATRGLSGLCIQRYLEFIKNSGG